MIQSTLIGSWVRWSYDRNPRDGVALDCVRRNRYMVLEGNRRRHMQAMKQVLYAATVGTMAGVALLCAMVPVALIGIAMHYLEIYFPI